MLSHCHVEMVVLRQYVGLNATVLILLYAL